MTAAVDELLSASRLNRRLLRRALHDLPDEAALFRVAPGSNHIAFLALHLLDARAWMANLMAGPTLKHDFTPLVDSARGVDDIEVYPPVGEILDGWETISDALETRLAAQTGESLAIDVGHEYPNGRSDLQGALGFLLHHESYHIGQVNLLRRAAGVGPIGFTE